MRVGFYLKWPKGSLARNKGNVLGDELYAESLTNALRVLNGVETAEVYAPNHQPDHKLDVLIHVNDTAPIRSLAKRHVLYMQNAYGEGSDKMLRRFEEVGYDGYAFISKKLTEMHIEAGHNGIFLPFGVDRAFFFPRSVNPDYAFEVSYIGNDIKGRVRSVAYLLPAADFRFGLFGNWTPKKLKLCFWQNWRNQPEYRRVFARISRGRIAQEMVPVLYSSASINLNCTAQDCVDWDVITLRTYEVLACRGFLISDRVKAAEKSMAGCLEFTDGGEDLVAKIKYYLDRPEARAEIAERGYQYVCRHATVEARATELLAYLEGLV